MPNGGSDCCGTCWFNRQNQGEAGLPKFGVKGPPYCEIRDIAIENPAYTYCANHPKRSPERDPIPIGPMLADKGNGREIWRQSPDTENVRSHLLDLLAQMEEQPPEEYSIGSYQYNVVVWQLGEFREKQALSHLNRIAELNPNPGTSIDDNGSFRPTRQSLAEIVQNAIGKIRDLE